MFLLKICIAKNSVEVLGLRRYELERDCCVLRPLSLGDVTFQQVPPNIRVSHDPVQGTQPRRRIIPHEGQSDIYKLRKNAPTSDLQEFCNECKRQIGSSSRINTAEKKHDFPINAIQGKLL